MKRVLFAVLMSLVLIMTTACLSNGFPAENTGNETAGTDISEPDTSDDTSLTYYTVTFDTDGGTAIESQSVKKGETVIKPADPQKAAVTLNSIKTIYEFDGWYIEEEEYDFNSGITSDLTITAKWTTEKYSVPLPKRN